MSDNKIEVKLTDDGLFPRAIVSSIMANSPIPKTQEELDLYIVKFFHNVNLVKDRIQYFNANPDEVNKYIEKLNK